MRVFMFAAVMAVASIASAVENRSAAYIQRTMKMLEESTKEKPAHVRVMFYGQSITAQAWTKLVEKQLQERYPTAEFEFRNAAIGGYTSNVLIRTADHDLYPWYPDLLFFHVYGPMEQYEEIVRRVRQRTSAEIVIWTSHLNIASVDKPDEINTSHDERAAEIRKVAPKHQCMLIDLREKWRKHLAEKSLAVKDLLTDAVHLNPQGCELYARLITEELVRVPELGDNPTAAGTITAVPVGSQELTRGSDGSLTLRFSGNCVVAVSDATGAPGARAKVLLDGKPMEGSKELWAISRPSVGPAKIWMPAINHIGFERPPIEEDWTLRCLPDSTPDGTKIHFRVQGSVTGEDGEGWNTERFVSRSGRAVIEPGDWRIAWTLGYRKATLPEGFQVTWQAYPLFASTYRPQPDAARTLLVQGCDNRRHTLTLVPEGGELGIGQFVVYAPAAGADAGDRAGSAAAKTAEEPEILTPPPAPEPRINGAKVFGVRPGHPVLYTIAATGRRPMTFSAENLPDGLSIDAETGQFSGCVAERGTYRVMLRAENSLGSAERELRIVVGDQLLLTPLLGCNTWGGWGAKVTDANLRAAAKAMVDSGLVQHGWQYINIDDGWQGHRGGPHNAILPNEKFPDMKAVCDYIHGLGLKAGIYSTPWTTSYAGFVGGSSDDPKGAWEPPKRRTDGWRCGKYFFETNDARQWAEWGFDYAKYDWRVDDVELTRRMVDALAGCDRDIVLELSNSVPLDKAAEHTSLAHLSRTTGDLVDFWDRSRMPESIRRWAVGIREVWLAHDVWAPHQRPGHWNHACNLRVGLLGGWRDQPLTPTHLTPDEQYTHISLWCLWGSPMIIGTPIERLDPFTLSLLSNDEVLEVQQDPLGIQGRRTVARGGEAVVKPLEDGSKAVGLLNPGDEPAEVTIEWSTLGLKGKQKVRDLWRQKDLGVHSAKFTANVRPHGVVLVRAEAAGAPGSGNSGG